jgi:predicted nucleic acid-binding protein
MSMKPTVYVETTIPSYYCDDRPGLAADIARTREWWDQERSAYECFVSPIVIDELSVGVYPTKSACLDLIRDLPILAVQSEAVEIAEAYQARGLMPRDPVRDALHVALASYYRMDYLLTWNCRHIANVNKAARLAVVNQQMGLPVPRLITPHLLLPLEDTP